MIWTTLSHRSEAPVVSRHGVRADDGAGFVGARAALVAGGGGATGIIPPEVPGISLASVLVLEVEGCGG